jgi:hypothetical protein
MRRVAIQLAALASAALLLATCSGKVAPGGATSPDTNGDTGGTSDSGAGGGSGAGGSESGGATTGVGEPLACVLNSDCPGALVCLSGLCHAQCAAAKDCPANQRCVQTASTPTCQLLSEAHCVHNSDCVVPLVCAPDLQCRNQCVTARDCITGELCVTGVCANPSEVNASGQLQGVPGG